MNFDSEILAQLIEEAADPAPSPEELYDQSERERRLTEVVAQMPPVQKAVFLLARGQGLSHADIAARLGISVHTVKKHMLRAICRCRNALTDV